MPMEDTAHPAATSSMGVQPSEPPEDDDDLSQPRKGGGVVGCVCYHSTRRGGGAVLGVGETGKTNSRKAADRLHTGSAASDH
jgi:hypothetical protein